MPSKQKITVAIDEDGSTEIEGHGFKGGLCEKATAFLEKALGTIKKRTRKPDRFRNDRQQCRTH